MYCVHCYNIIVLIFPFIVCNIGLEALGSGIGTSSTSVINPPPGSCPSLSGAHTGRLDLGPNPHA